ATGSVREHRYVPGRPGRARAVDLPGLHAAPAGKVLMTGNGWLQILVFSVAVLCLTKPMGLYLLRVYDGSLRWLAPVERIIYRLCGIDPLDDQYWIRYAAALLLFSALSIPTAPLRPAAMASRARTSTL